MDEGKWWFAHPPLKPSRSAGEIMEKIWQTPNTDQQGLGAAVSTGSATEVGGLKQPTPQGQPVDRLTCAQTGDGRGARRGADVRHTALELMNHWHTSGWTTSERQVLTRPQRLDRAAERQEHRPVRRLQQLWRRSRAAKLFAVRTVSPENQGKKTPGVAGVANRTPPARLDLVPHLPRADNASPVRRGSRPQPATMEPRPVGIPPLVARAQQRWVTPALEPAGAAQFEPTGEGFRPGRSTGEAMGAIDGPINQQPTGVGGAAIATGVARIPHTAW